MKLYLSSKMTGLPAENYPAFFNMERILREQGHAIINPAKIGKDLDSIFSNPTRRDYLTADILELLECDGIVLFGNWIKSSGALLERQIAHQLGMSVFIFDEKTCFLKKEGHYESSKN
jgi:hypothetical protein